MPALRLSLPAVAAFVALGLSVLPASQARAQARCADLDACRQALRAGAYESAEEGLGALRRGRTQAEATLLLGHVYLETGRYSEAAEIARPLAAGGASRVEAATLLAEAEAARGRLDEAEAALTPIASEPSAHRGRVVLARVLMRRGRTSDAQRPLDALIGAYNDSTIGPRDAEGLAYVGMAAQLLQSPQDANDAFQQSVAVDAERVETQLEWATLFLSAYDAGHAEEGVRAALAVNAHSARAQALMARIELEQSMNFNAAGEALDAALEVNPNLVMAHVTRAGMAVRNMDLEGASAHVDRALATDPNDLEALSVRAAIRFLSEDTPGYRAAVREVLQRNPRFSEMYTIIAEYAEWEHRYPQIVEMAQEALRIDPSDSRAQATLGLNLLRMGREEEGLEALRRAWNRDRFNVRVYNVLNLFEGPIANDYVTVDATPFRFRLHREEQPIMERYVTTTLRAAWADMRRRYGFTPTTPVHIEMFSSVEHFSVRTAGLPNIGVQGVCFGQVVTALSPRAGPFNWAQIVWHELAHVFHIQMSNNRVPRWFTEGLAEYETILARPEWQRHQDHRLYAALAGGRLPPLADLNHAFTHARSQADISVAYYASSMIVKYIGERFGFPALARMLREWGRGSTSAEVIERVLDVSVDQLDQDFRAHTRERLAARANDFSVDYSAYSDLDAIRTAAEASPSDADAQAALSAALLAHGEAQPATEAMHRSLRLNREQPIARFTAARLAMARRDTQTARADLRLLIESGHDGYDVRLMQARVALALQHAPLARTALDAAARIDPERPEALQGLMQLAERTEDAGLRARVLRQLVDVDQHDAASNFALMQSLREAEDWATLRTYGERSIYVDPLRADARLLYSEALLNTGDARAALLEIETGLASEPEAPGPFHLQRARALSALGQRREARAAAAAASAADPSLAAEAAAIR